MKLPLPFHGLESNRMARFDSHFDLAGQAARDGRAKRYFRATSQALREARETRNALMNLWRGIRELQGETS